MTDSQGDIRSSRTLSKSAQGEVCTSEDEIDLSDCLRILRKWRYLIVIGSALPALIMGLFVFFSPTYYEVTYRYDVLRDRGIDALWPGSLFEAAGLDEAIDESETGESDEERCEALIDRFYGAENFGRLTARLRENGFEEYLENMSGRSIRLEISDPLLAMTIVARPHKDVRRIVSIVRDNFEMVVPTYSLKERLRNTMVGLRVAMAGIERGKFDLMLELRQKKAVLEKLKNAQPPDSNESPGGIVLHLHDMDADSKYLPIACQAQAAHASVINLEEVVSASTERCSYYESLLNLNARLSGEMGGRADSHFTIGQFRSYLAGLAEEYEDENLTDYLKAYARAIEQMMLANTPIGEEPSIYPVPKGTAKKAMIVFVALLMVSGCGVLLLEAVGKCQSQVA